MQIMGDYKKQKNKRSRLSDFVNTTRTLSSSAFIISLFPIEAKQISTIMSTITLNIIINAAEDIVNLPQSRNDTFNRRWNSAFGASPEVCSVLWNKIDPFKRTFRHQIQLKFRQLIRRGRRRFHDGSGGKDLAIRVEIRQLCHPPGRDWRRTRGFDS